ncbi:hypothetical protein BJN34_13960 [Cupriavidus necator]|uniref:Lipoprotein n=1 Tax=Cupriavidus necator TaxID=106590 RepID=A0A1U9URT9_CUPNE|nr:hypothetical protein BJN34_13960 [Cupriavidus necator]
MRNDSGESATLQRTALALTAACATASLAGCMVVAVGSAAVSTVGSAAVSVATTAVSTTYDITAAGVKAVAGSDDPPASPPPVQ